MKTFTAEEFEIEFYKAMHEWVQGGKVGPDPREAWEFSTYSDYWTTPPTKMPDFVSYAKYRWKPAKKRTVVIDGVELVAPEVNAPSFGDEFFIEWVFGDIVKLNWDGRYAALKNGKIFLTREDAEAMADAQRKQRMGGVL